MNIEFYTSHKKEDELKNKIETEICKDKKFLKYMRDLGWCKED